MKKLTFIIYFFLVGYSIFPQVNIPNFIRHYAEDIIFFVGNNNQLYECDTFGKKYRNITNLCYYDNNGYLRINYKKNETSYFIIKEESHYLILSPRQLFVFMGDSWLNVFKDVIEYERYENIFISSIKSNVYLREGKSEYSPQNLLKKFFRTDGGFPYDYWSKSLPLAISDKQINNFEMEIKFQNDVEGILLLNGFVDFYRPNLFKANRRIKEILIVDRNNSFRQNYILKDKIEFQEIVFPKLTDSIVIKILSYYEGNRYTDVCCSAIIPLYNTSMFRQSRLYADPNFDNYAKDYNTFIKEMLETYKEIK